MKIFFVYLDINNTQPFEYQVGLGYVSAIAKFKGHLTRYFSPRTEFDIRNLIKEIKNVLPEVIAFSIVSTQFRYVKTIAREIKRYYSPKVICGGIHPTIYPECLEESEYIDGIVRGEGEYPLSEYLEMLSKNGNYTHLSNFWFREKGKIVKNMMRPLIENLDSLPFPDRESLDFQEAIDRIGFCSFIFSRGCPFNCYYCCNSILNKIYGSNHVRFRSVDKSLEEIDLVLSKYKIKRLQFLNFDDDNLNINKEWFLEFVEKYKKNIKIKFKCNIKVGFCNLEMFKMLKEANCICVRIGVECGDENFRKRYLNRHMTNKQIIETFEMAHKAGLRTYSFNILGFPYETPELCDRTIELNAKLHPNIPFAGIFYPYPKTYLRELCEQNNLLIDRHLEDRDIRERDEPVLSSPYFSKEEVMYYYKNFNYLVLRHLSFLKAILYKIHQELELFISNSVKIIKKVISRNRR